MYKHMYRYMYTCTCMYVYVYVCVHAFARVYVYLHVYANANVCTFAFCLSVYRVLAALLSASGLDEAFPKLLGYVCVLQPTNAKMAAW